jgi:uncharacterized membrane protein YfhO
MVFGGYRVVPDAGSQLSALKRPDFPLHRELILNTEFQNNFPSAARFTSFSVEAVRSEEDELYFDLPLSQPGLLFINENFHPGWKATVNGIAAQVLPANVNFMAVPLAVGKNAIRLYFEPFYCALIRKLILLGIASALVFFSFLNWGKLRERYR